MVLPLGGVGGGVELGGCEDLYGATLYVGLFVVMVDRLGGSMKCCSRW